ncbi:MAG TPA: HAMP domain-containing sensor histidine kinase [Polyangiaceae bacterium]|nr:HAMP domain-containing sensor histidine kinase [Polyangiaceae bacterium]
MGLRFRLLAASFLLTAVTLGLVFGALFQQLTRLPEARLDRRLREDAVEEAADAPSRGFQFLPRRAAFRGVFYGDQDRPITATGPFATKPPSRTYIAHDAGEPFNFTHEGVRYRAVFVEVPGHPQKALLAASARTELDDLSEARRDALALAYLAALVWTSILTYVVARRATRDHDRIADVAHRVTSGDLTARVGARTGDAELMQLSTDIDDMVDTIAMLLAAQRRFLANAAHELRSPLTKLYGELQLAVRKDRDAPELRRAIRSALESTQALKELTDDLLTLARTSVESALEDASLEAIVGNAVELARARAEELGVQFELSGLDIVVSGRPNDLSRLFRNLIDNAVTHSPRGSLVRVTGTLEGSFAVVVVEDEGEGVPPEDRARIFEPFFRGARSRALATGGSGLGLGIAREVARTHGGNLTLDSSVWGARFVVELPIAATRPSKTAYD